MCKFFTLLLLLLSSIYSAFALAKPNRIINDQDYPFVVAIYNNSRDEHSNETICTGTIIDKTWVLTAAHCVYDFDANVFVRPYQRSIGLGHLAAYKTSAKKIIPVKQIYVFNNKRDDKFTRDVALLKLNESTSVTPVQLPSARNDFSAVKSGNYPAVAVGYGVKNFMIPPGYHKDIHLNFGNEKICSDETTSNLLAKFRRLENIRRHSDDPVYNASTMLGATAIDGIPPTNHDSGGPLLIKTKKADKFVQIGVISWGLPPNNLSYKKGYMKKEPGIYANLTNKETLAFIRKTMEENS